MEIHASIVDPSSKYYMGGKNEKSNVTVFHCSAEECSLRSLGKCLLRNSFDTCVYGKRKREYGYTRRAKKLSSWLSSRKSRYADILNAMDMPSNRGIFDVGEYWVLKFPHIEMNKEVLFYKHSYPLVSGIPFILKSDLIEEAVRSICSFHPRSMMGSVIESYQHEEVPYFLYCLKKTIPDLYEAVKELDVSPVNFVGKTALLHSLKEGVYEDGWEWDGEFLSKEENHILSSPLRFGSQKKVYIRIEPTEDAVIKITDNDQVDDDTVFA